jgi:class 3 adenylate cyclase
MPSAPQTQYAKSGGAHIAYQVVGEGPVDLVVFGALASHVEMIWEDPTAARFLRRLASFSRLIIYDKLGVGMSDPIPGGESSFEQRLESCRAVLDAAGCAEGVFLGISEGGALAALMAATDPARVRGIVTFASYARLVRAPGYPYGRSRETLERFLDEIDEHWDTEYLLELVLPSVMHDEPRKAFWHRYFRTAITPGQFRLQVEQNAAADISAALPLVQAPALVIHGVDDRWIPIGHSEYLANLLPHARLLAIPTGDHLPFADAGLQVAVEIQEFVTGTREAPHPERRLATIMFSDIVDSTATAAAAGDRRWIDLLQRHDDLVRRELARFRGREIKHTGDGFLAVFDGPAQGIRCGRAIAQEMALTGLHVKIGLHTGEAEMRGADVAGIAVHIAARVAALAGEGEVVVSQSIPPLVVGSGLQFTSVGRHSLKGVPGEWELFRVTG